MSKLSNLFHTIFFIQLITSYTNIEEPREKKDGRKKGRKEERKEGKKEGRTGLKEEEVEEAAKEEEEEAEEEEKEEKEEKEEESKALVSSQASYRRTLVTESDVRSASRILLVTHGP
ncbi:hypothetical protein HZH68_004524 [Vespula germanica]|uniref:Uncharacterized protein n=1 Tax=Vespula germanica TaxID=30212 RepID=A0A834KNX3_VESGE|nr:hypothetical protein HZH68_004524 [Vespula germanica]